MTEILQPAITINIVGQNFGGNIGSSTQVGGELPFGSSAISFVEHNGVDTATVFTKYPHNFTMGQEVDIFNVDESAYNGTNIVIVVISPTSFSYSLVGSPVSPSGGANAYAIASSGGSDLDATTDEYWDSWLGSSVVYSFSGGQWSHAVEDLEVEMGLQERSTGTPGNWVAGFRPSSVEITINSASDEGNFGFLTGQNIEIRDSVGAVIGSDSFDFSSYNETLVRSIPLTFAGNDIDVLFIESFLYNTGPLIQQIIFKA